MEKKVDGVINKKRYFTVVRQEDLNLNDELKKDLKEDLRIICSKYGVQIQDANEKASIHLENKKE